MKSINIYKEQTMTSLEIAELTGKQHKDVLKAIRNLEPAWVNIAGRNFALGSKMEHEGLAPASRRRRNLGSDDSLLEM